MSNTNSIDISTNAEHIDKDMQDMQEISCKKTFVSLPEEIEAFEKLIKECAEQAREEGKEEHNQCLALFRCIPNTNRTIWDKLSKDYNYKEWLTLDIDLANISAQGFMEAIVVKNQEYKQAQEDAFDHSRIKQAKCLVQAHEKQFLFFGTL